MTSTPWIQDEDVLSAGPDQGTFAVLEPGECSSLLHDGVVGRVAFADPRLTVVPIAYDWVEGLVVFRTSPASSLARLPGTEIAFEVDDIDPETGVGWSVLVRGRVEYAADELAEAVTPWAAGERRLVLSIRPDEMSGRVVSRPEPGQGLTGPGTSAVPPQGRER